VVERRSIRRHNNWIEATFAATFRGENWRKAVKSRFKIILGVLPFLSMACAHAQFQKPPSGEEFNGKFPAIWMEQMTFAYKNLLEEGDDPSCFYVETYQREDRYYIDFLPRITEISDGDEVRFVPTGGEDCGTGVSYEFDSSGQFLRRIYQR